MGMPYEERLRKLKLPTMTYRRARGLMMEVWKHINSYDTAVISPTFQFTRSAWYHLQLKRFNFKGSQFKSFYHLAPTLWNDLPLAVGEAECRNTFKNRLDKHWSGHPMRRLLMIWVCNHLQTRNKLYMRLHHRRSSLCNNTTRFN